MKNYKSIVTRKSLKC